MVSRATLTVVLAAFVLLSGCSGLVGNGGGDGTPTEELPEDPSAFEHADGFGAEGVTDGETALETYTAAVQTQDNYTADYGYVVTTGEGETDVDVEYRVDFEAEQAYQHAEVASPRVNATINNYYENDKRYSLAEYEGEQGNVSVENETFPPEQLTASEAVEPLLLNATDYNATVDRRNGVPVVVYQTTDIDNANGVLGVNDPDSVSDFQATFVVDSDGVIHSATYELAYMVDGEERSATMEFELTNLGDTTVERPEWADQTGDS
ncbi:hypothetical protein HWV23_16905 [Natronomonas halophila]|uniref:DUF7537 family lipoprotein n=1 Tax=Natronomonas halophila TaxID=2747817 RepID=UPI0015B7243A|nr:hypothetical protein [Natronomonas halophila]QLD87331.1 hypothetical protein HWV23_16905 [Natronomonas halophila]